MPEAIEWGHGLAALIEIENLRRPRRSNADQRDKNEENF
jgi:hypothetical protein